MRPKKGFKLSEEHKRKIGIANRGKKHTASFGDRIRKRMTGSKCSEETKRKMSLAHQGRRPYEMTDAIRKKMSEVQMGRPHPWNSGANSPQWKGGITPLRKKLYFSQEYKNWRKAVFERDGYTCVWCSKKGGELNADHIKPWSLFPDLRFDLSNGRTLCVPCHRKTETYGVKIKFIDKISEYEGLKLDKTVIPNANAK